MDLLHLDNFGQYIGGSILVYSVSPPPVPSLLVLSLSLSLMSGINSPAFAGVRDAAKPTHTPLDDIDLADDLEAEREGLPDMDLAEDVSAEQLDMINELQLAMLHASKGVSEETDKKYCG